VAGVTTVFTMAAGAVAVHHVGAAAEPHHEVEQRGKDE
jgi:hypothetical protein